LAELAYVVDTDAGTGLVGDVQGAKGGGGPVDISLLEVGSGDAGEDPRLVLWVLMQCRQGGIERWLRLVGSAQADGGDARNPQSTVAPDND
jgi:hypothetical protein